MISLNTEQVDSLSDQSFATHFKIMNRGKFNFITSFCEAVKLAAFD